MEKEYGKSLLYLFRLNKIFGNKLNTISYEELLYHINNYKIILLKYNKYLPILFDLILFKINIEPNINVKELNKIIKNFNLLIKY